MEAAVAVGFAFFDIILLIHDSKARNRGQAVPDRVDVVDEGADDADPDGVVDIREGGVLGFGQALAAAFFAHALLGFDAGEEVFDGVGAGLLGELLPDGGDLGEDRVHGIGQFRKMGTVDACLRHGKTPLFGTAIIHGFCEELINK